MISRRNVRATGPQEQPRMFALNYSKGVDITKPPTDNSTVLNATNLYINQDGSLTLRKPLKHLFTAEPDWLGFDYLHDRNSKIYWSEDFIQLMPNSATSVVFKILNYEGTYETFEASQITSGTFEISADSPPVVLRLNDTTIVGNVRVNLSKFSETLLNPTLYESVDVYLPRYLKIYEETEGAWTIEVVSPEPNLLQAVEGEIALNPNLTLDNPMALRDSYENSVPSISGILAYTKSTVKMDETVYDPSDVVAVSKTVNQTLPRVMGPSTTTTTATLDVLGDTALADLVTVTARLEGTEGNSEVDVKRITGDVQLDVTSSIFEEHPEASVAVVLRTVCTLFVKISQNTVEYTKVLREDVYEDSVTLTKDYQSEEFWHSKFEDYRLNAITSYISGRAQFNITATVRIRDAEDLPATVAELTESVKITKYSPVGTFARNEVSLAFLKAFCRFPFTSGSYYAAWFRSFDNLDWSPIGNYPNGIQVRELDANWSPNSDDDNPAASDYVTRTYYPMRGTSELDELYASNGLLNRVDFLELPVGQIYIDAAIYKFRIIAVSEVVEGDVEYAEDVSGTQYRIDAVVDESQYTPAMSSKTELLTTDLGNSVLGKKLYYKKAIYSYGDPSFKTNILVSDTGSFITPTYNIIDVETSGASEVNCMLAWRDYLVSATDYSINLHVKQSEGYSSKVVSTSVGIPEEDSACCKAILNGILFKSGAKIYQMVPNVYSGDDTVLNMRVISNPVETYLEEWYLEDAKPFAIATESEYILMLPRQLDTLCLRYEYTAGTWAVMVYPVVLNRYWIEDVSHIHVFGYRGGESYVGYEEWLLDSDIRCPYDEVGSNKVYIPFELDSGQKTDGISNRKQFVESKFVFATEDDAEVFPMELTVAIDGDPHVTTIDVSTDAPFLKSNQTAGVAGTTFRLTNDTEVVGNSESGILRQLVVRYSGKGHAIRHILTGIAHSNFKLYETYVKYKPLKR